MKPEQRETLESLLRESIAIILNDFEKVENNDQKKDPGVEYIEEFFAFLQGTVPDKMKIGKSFMPKLTRKKAFTVIWYIQERLHLLPDNIELCWSCGSLFDTYSEGLYWETKNRHYCGGCDHLVPENYDKGKTNENSRINQTGRK
jgi:hypothetical protein